MNSPFTATGTRSEGRIYDNVKKIIIDDYVYNFKQSYLQSCRGIKEKS